MDRNPSPQKRRCPFIQDPFADCYVARLRSQDVGNAICFCGGAFEACEIYQKEMKEMSATRRPEDKEVMKTG